MEMESSLDDLIEKASTLVGRRVEVDRTKGGGYIVLYMCFGKSPPPKGSTPEEAVENFIKYAENFRPIDVGSDNDYQELQKKLEAEAEGDGT